MLFDIRSVIAGLLGCYGLVLVITGLVQSPGDYQAKTGGVNANLWTGLVLLLVAVGLLAWVRLRPSHTRPPEEADEKTPES